MYKEFVKGKKVVVFDLDGTIVDTAVLSTQAYEEVFVSLGIEPEGYAGIIGVGKHVNEVLKKVQERVGTLPVAASEIATQVFNKILQKLPESGLDVKRGFWELACALKEEKGMKLALVTNTVRRAAEAELSYLGIEKTFDFVVCGDEVKNPKPDPEMYKKVIHKFGVKPHEVLSFEDSPTGVKAAKDAGTDVIVVWDGKIDEDEYPKGTLAFIQDFSNLYGKLDQDFQELLEEAADAWEQPEEPSE